MTALATRATDLAPSPIRTFTHGGPAEAIDLALGQPGWALPRAARNALADEGQDTSALGYGPNAGIPDLVTAIADHHGASEDLPGDPGASQVMVTAGSQAALFALFQSHVEPGTSVLVPDPGFVSYATLATVCGARPVRYPLAADGGLDALSLIETLSSAGPTSLVVLNHPGNPTGGLATGSGLVQVAEACAAAGSLLVSDEVYRELWLDRRPVGLHQAAGLEAGVVLGSVSKAWGAPGLRVGWAVGPEPVLAPARLMHNAMTTAPALPSQRAALALLSDRTVLPEMRGHLSERWSLAAQVAPELVAAGSTHGRVGFYLWLPLPRRAAGPSGPTIADGHSAEDVAVHLRDRIGVRCVPGTAFGPGGHGRLRVSLGGSLDAVNDGLARLAPWWKA